MIRSTETIHLYCSGSNIVSKWTEIRFHITNITYVFHWVHPKWFSSLWYVWRKSWTCVSSRLALSPNGPKRAATWASSPRSTIACIKNDFLSLWYDWRKSCTYIAPTLTLSPIGPKQDSSWPKQVPSDASMMIFKPMVCAAQTAHLSCIKNYLQTDSNKRPLEPRT
jgi:hypothetical protein